jgi:hypothetical protein
LVLLKLLAVVFTGRAAVNAEKKKACDLTICYAATLKAADAKIRTRQNVGMMASEKKPIHCGNCGVA